MISQSEQINHPQPTEREAERLHLLIEECGEVIQAATKILRHGYTNFHPDFPDTTNKTNLEREIGDLNFVISMMYDGCDVNDCWSHR